MLSPSGASAGSDKKQLISEMVEGCSKILNSVSQDDRNLLRNGLNLSHVIDWSSGFRVAPSLNLVRLGGHERRDSLVEIKDMLVSSLDLMPDERKSVVGLHFPFAFSPSSTGYLVGGAPQALFR
jgi:hypothetical protein